MNNNYDTPKSELIDHDQNSEKNKKVSNVAEGQKFIIYAILAYFLSIGITLILTPVGGLGLLVALGLGLYGFIKLCRALGSSIIGTIMACIGMLIPLISLIILLVASSRATKFLQENGYKVGLLGAKKI